MPVLKYSAVIFKALNLGRRAKIGIDMNDLLLCTYACFLLFSDSIEYSAGVDRTTGQNRTTRLLTVSLSK